MALLENKVLQRAKLRWTIFKYNFGWSSYVPLFDGWLARAAMAVPIVGYLILFNDSISEMLTFRKLAQEGSAVKGLSPSARLKLLYFGLLLLGASNIVYRVRRPHILKLGSTAHDYVNAGLTNFTAITYVNLDDGIKHEGPRTQHGKYHDAEFKSFIDLALDCDDKTGKSFRLPNWNQAKFQYEGLLRSLLTETFYRHNVERRASLILCVSLSISGYALLFIPSLDLFLKILHVTFS